MCMMKGYPNLCTSLKECNPISFGVGLYSAYISELSNDMIVEKQYKTTSKGTNFLYKKIEKQEEFEKYKDKLDLIIKETYINQTSINCDSGLIQVLGIGACE